MEEVGTVKSPTPKNPTKKKIHQVLIQEQVVASTHNNKEEVLKYQNDIVYSDNDTRQKNDVVSKSKNRSIQKIPCSNNNNKSFV